MAVAGQVLDAVDFELRADPAVVVVDERRGQEALRAEAEQLVVAGDEVHRRRPEEGRDERVRRTRVDLLRRAELAQPARRT